MTSDKQASIAPAYISLYPRLVEIAKEYGYALAIHGSVNRDMDLIAVPWGDIVKPPRALIRAFAKYFRIMFDSTDGKGIPVSAPEMKPHNRFAWALPIGAGAVVDISIIPIAKHTGPTKALSCVYANDTAALDELCTEEHLLIVPVIKLDTRSRNNRIYPESVMVTAVEQAMEHINKYGPHPGTTGPGAPSIFTSALRPITHTIEEVFICDGELRAVMRLTECGEAYVQEITNLGDTVVGQLAFTFMTAIDNITVTECTILSIELIPKRIWGFDHDHTDN